MSASHANTASVAARPVGFASAGVLGARVRERLQAAMAFMADVEAHEVIEGATLLGLSTAASVLLLAALGW